MNSISVAFSGCEVGISWQLPGLWMTYIRHYWACFLKVRRPPNSTPGRRKKDQHPLVSNVSFLGKRRSVSFLLGSMGHTRPFFICLPHLKAAPSLMSKSGPQKTRRKYFVPSSSLSSPNQRSLHPFRGPPAPRLGRDVEAAERSHSLAITVGGTKHKDNLCPQREGNIEV